MGICRDGNAICIVLIHAVQNNSSKCDDDDEMRIGIDHTGSDLKQEFLLLEQHHPDMWWPLFLQPCTAIPYHTYHTILPYIQYHTIQYLSVIVPHHTIPYLPYHTIPYHTYHSMPCHTIPYHTRYTTVIYICDDHCSCNVTYCDEMWHIAMWCNVTFCDVLWCNVTWWPMFL